MLATLLSSKSTLQKVMLFMAAFFAFGFYVFGTRIVGYSLGYVIGMVLALLPFVIPRLILMGGIWYLIWHYLSNRK